MPTYKITLPDGRRATVEGTPEQLDAALQSLQAPVPAQPAAPQSPAEHPALAHVRATRENLAATRPAVRQGFMDPVFGASQLLYNALPGAVTRPVNKLNEALMGAGIPLAPVPPGGVSEQIREREKAYQERSGRTSYDDWWRIGGQMLSPMPLLMSRGGSAVGNLVNKATSKLSGNEILGGITTGVLGGAGMGATMPVTEDVTDDEYWGEVLRQAGIGAATGLVTPLVGEGIARAVSPKGTKAVETLRAAGVKNIPPGQVLGGPFKTFEEKLVSAPILGDAIRTNIRRGFEDLNSAVYNRVLGNIGKSMPKTVEPGRRSIDYVNNTISKAYDDALKPMVGRLDDELRAGLGSLKESVKRYNWPEEKESEFVRAITNHVEKRFINEKASGETLKKIERKLRTIAERKGRSDDVDEQDMAEAFLRARDLVRDMEMRINPEHAPKLRAADAAWSEYKVLEKAGTYAKDADGIFTPAQLDRAVAVQGDRVRKGVSARGQALMQDLSGAGREVMAPTVPNSGSIDRLLAAAATGGAGYLDPHVAALAMGAAGASIPYLPGISRGVTSLMTPRGPQAQAAAQAIRQVTPALAPAFTLPLMGPTVTVGMPQTVPGF